MSHPMPATEASAATADYYQQNGYVVIRGVLPAAKIDALVETYEREILPSKGKFYRQSTAAYEPNRLTAAGYVIQSFLDIHHYRRFPRFREIALDIYFSGEMLSALREVTGHREHDLMQSMLFDANTTTPPHQDWWYLDTVPNGHLLGSWIALEDIHEDAGRFFVMPGSQHVRLHRENMPHSEWIALMKKYFDDNQDKVSTPALRKGDVLFWNSRTVHGSLPTRDPSRSRRSLTAHYMPAGMTFGNLFTSKPWVTFENVGGHSYFANQPEYSLKADLVSRIKSAVYDSPRSLKLLRKFQRKSVAEV